MVHQLGDVEEANVLSWTGHRVGHTGLEFRQTSISVGSVSDLRAVCFKVDLCCRPVGIFQLLTCGAFHLGVDFVNVEGLATSPGVIRVFGLDPFSLATGGGGR
jgi:hypothetical protein